MSCVVSSDCCTWRCLQVSFILSHLFRLSLSLFLSSLSLSQIRICFLSLLSKGESPSLVTAVINIIKEHRQPTQLSIHFISLSSVSRQIKLDSHSHRHILKILMTDVTGDSALPDSHRPANTASPSMMKKKRYTPMKMTSSGNTLLFLHHHYHLQWKNEMGWTSHRQLKDSERRTRKEAGKRWMCSQGKKVQINLYPRKRERRRCKEQLRQLLSSLTDLSSIAMLF